MSESVESMETKSYIRRSIEELEKKGKYPDPNILTFSDDAARERAYKHRVWSQVCIRIVVIIASVVTGTNIGNAFLSAWLTPMM